MILDVCGLKLAWDERGDCKGNFFEHLIDRLSNYPASLFFLFFEKKSLVLFAIKLRTVSILVGSWEDKLVHAVAVIWLFTPHCPDKFVFLQLTPLKWE